MLAGGSWNAAGSRTGIQAVRWSDIEARTGNSLRGPCGRCHPFTALFTSAAIFASSAALNCFSANEVGHMAPSSSFA